MEMLCLLALALDKMFTPLSPNGFSRSKSVSLVPSENSTQERTVWGFEIREREEVEGGRSGLSGAHGASFAISIPT